MRHTPLHRLLIAAGTALVLALAGCGTGSGTAPASRGTIVRLGFSAWPGWFPWQIAEEVGLFEKNGVEVELTYYDNYSDSLYALTTNNLDANSQTLNDTLSSVSNGAAQTIVLVNDNSTGNDQIIAREGIRSVADLKGKTVAAEQGTVDHYLLLLALKRAGLAQKDIRFQPLSTDAAAAAFVAGQLDAVGVFAPFTTTALARAGSTVIASSRDFPGAVPDHLAFATAYVEKHPTEVQAVVQTWFDTVKWIKENRDRALAIMAKRGGVTVEDYKTYDAGTTIFTRDDNLAAFKAGESPSSLVFQAVSIADFLVASGLAATKPSVAGLLEPRFVEAATA